MSRSLSSTASLSFSSASPQDWQDIVLFQQSAYPHHGWSLDYLKWEYEKNPAGRAQVWIARLREAVVGCYAAVPHAVLVQGKKSLGWRMEHLLIRPDCRNLGIHLSFTRLSKKFLQQSDAGFSFAFPNNRSYPGFVGTGWKAIRHLPLFVHTLSNDATPKASSQVSVDALSSFEDDACLTWKNYSKRFDFTLDRTPEYLNWRYFQNPHTHYFGFRLSYEGKVAFLVLKIYKNLQGEKWAHICDFFQAPYDDKTLGETALLHARQFAREQNCQKVSLWCGPENSLAFDLEKCSFVPQFQDRWFVVLMPQTQGASEKRWQMMMGDSDVF